MSKDVWIGAHGKPYAIREMSDQHLENAIKLAERTISTAKQMSEKLPLLKIEREHRRFRRSCFDDHGREYCCPCPCHNWHETGQIDRSVYAP